MDSLKTLSMLKYSYYTITKLKVYMSSPLILDISSIISENKGVAAILSIASIIQHSNNVSGVIPVVSDINKDISESVRGELESKGIKYLNIEGSLSGYIASLPAGAHIVSDDPLVISKIKDSLTYWDHEDMTQYQASDLKEMMGFESSATTVYSILRGTTFYDMPALDKVMQTEAIDVSRRFSTVKALLKADLMDLPKSIADRMNEIKTRAAFLASKVKINSNELEWDKFANKLEIKKGQLSEIDTSSVFKINELQNLNALYTVFDTTSNINMSFVGNQLLVTNGDETVLCNISDSLPEKNVIEMLASRLSESKITPFMFESKELRKRFIKFDIKIPTIIDISELAYSANNLDKEPVLEKLIETKLNKEGSFDMDPDSQSDNLRKLPDIYDAIMNSLSDVQQRYYHEIALPVLNVIAEMESTGMKLDAQRLNLVDEKFKNMIEHCNNFVADTLGQSFDLTDRAAVSKLLYDVLKIKPLTDKRSTDKETINEFLKLYPEKGPIITAVSLALKQSELVNKCTNKYAEFIDNESGHIHPTLNTKSTKTGRLSCTEPNMMGIPSKGNEGKLIKSCFIAPEGMAIVKADYSQIELKVLAHMSGDPVLVNGFRQGLDIHRATAASVFEKAYEDVTDEERSATKSINFGLIYGMQKNSLAIKLGKTEKEAEAFINTYFQKLPKVKQFLDWTKKNAIEKGFIKTLFHRHIHIENAQSKNRYQVMAAERQASNAPMQGTAAEIVKKAMVDLHKIKEAEGLNFKMVMQVHDEIILYSPIEEVDRASDALKRAMENAVKLKVPINVDVDVGYSLISKKMEDKDSYDWRLAI